LSWGGIPTDASKQMFIRCKNDSWRIKRGPSYRSRHQRFLPSCVHAFQERHMDRKPLAVSGFPSACALGSPGWSIVAAILLPNAGEGGAQPVVEPRRSPMSGVGQVFGLRKSRAGACHAGSESFSATPQISCPEDPSLLCHPPRSRCSDCSDPSRIPRSPSKRLPTWPPKDRPHDLCLHSGKTGAH